ncbi:MAG: hypothetical protein ACYDHN_15215 [Solirubrobacteraceae bacterium]
MDSGAVFQRAHMRAGMYESFYLRAVAPDEPLGVWIRHTVHKAPGQAPRGSIWCTLFDAHAGRPFMHKRTSPQLTVPTGKWIAIGEEGWMGPGRTEGSCGAASWSLRFTTRESELRHLTPGWLYRSPLPRTKLTSPMPAARFEGTFELGERTIDLDGWRGMVGHNWGSEHAERWIWLHGVGFDSEPDAWLDVALGRLKLAGRMTPWVANGALSLGGRRHRLGGLGTRGLSVTESAEGCTLRLPGPHGVLVEGAIGVPEESAAGWRYADPDGGEHDVVNCSVARLRLTAKVFPGGPPLALQSAHGGVYELGMRERDHGVPIAPFADG